MHEALVLRGGGMFPTFWESQPGKVGQAEIWDVKGFCFEARMPGGDYNPSLSAEILEALRTHKTQPMKVRLMHDPVWWNHSLSPEALAKIMSEDITHFGCDNKQCSLMPDLERKDAEFILRCLKELNRLRPGRDLLWTLEGNQAGPGSWLRDTVAGKALIAWINGNARVKVAPQSYDANMLPWPADEMRVQMWDAGFQRDKVEIFYSHLNQFHDKKRYSGQLYDWDKFARKP